ncbi:MAG: GNAT family N-acetyltransferase [Acidimicrobiia bacterium]
MPPIVVTHHTDPLDVLDRAGTHLARDPVRHNLVATLLRRCAELGQSGRFWIAHTEGVDGIVFQWPVHFFAAATPMTDATITAMVDVIVDGGTILPGINAEAATAARFAGHWSERTRRGARPAEADRLYEVTTVIRPDPVGGTARAASEDERDLLISWFDAFEREAFGAPESDAATRVDQRLAAGELFVWDEGGAVAFAGLTAPMLGAVRIGPVYTPPDRRGHGFGSALVAELSHRVRAAGDRCLLYADLANPVSNGIYRAIGYRAVAEVVRYEFVAS